MSAKPMPFPARQLFVLALCRICEPIAFMSIFPYIYYMVLSFNITRDDRQIAIYAGLVASAFTLAEFSTGVLWGRLSDRIGRKPVLIFGLVGTALSMLMFGFARSLPSAMIARAVGGALNGNIGVLQTTVAELITVKEHQPRAYTIMPFIWCLGSILGPALGGSLAQPANTFPTLFPAGSLFARFPFLLPNLICFAVLLCGITIGILFLEETHSEKRHRRDVGLEAGQWILTKVRSLWAAESGYVELTEEIHRRRSLIDDEKVGYRNSDSLSRAGTSRSSSPGTLTPSSPHLDGLRAYERRKAGVETAFTRQVILTIVAYGVLAYHTMTFDQLFPVFLSTPVSNQKPLLPFKFMGGFGLNTQTIGLVMALQGAYSMFLQVFFCPVVLRWLGPLRTFQTAAFCYPVLHLITPYVSLLPSSVQMPGVYAILVFKITITVVAYPANAIQLTNAAPSLLVLGTINGVGASIASLARALGPTGSGLIYSYGLSINCSGLVWWVTSLICVGGAFQTLYLREGGGRFDNMDADTLSDTTAVDHEAMDDLCLETGEHELKKDLYFSPRETSPERCSTDSHN